MADLPLFSVITPSYNQAQYLEQTIQSVLNQDYPNLEYLVIDGASTDSSLEIIRKYADRLAFWVSEKDHGQAEAINKGLARARGEYIAWINSDDYYLPGALHSAARAFEQNPRCGMVFSNLLAVNGAGEPINIIRYGNYTLDDLMQFNMLGQPAVFMRRSFLERAGYLDQKLHYMLDHHLWLRLAQQAPMRYFDQVWAAARYHTSAKNVSQAPGFARETYEVVAWMQSQPSLEEQFHRLRRKIWAGAHRMNGRYLLDGGYPWRSLKAYLKSLLCYPPTALQEWRRILYAAASLFIDLEWVRQRFLARRKQAVKQILHQDTGKKEHS
ncbi:MAG TPA: glycosyltransferase family 2 protein [Anaerolineaceae bacterium]